MKYFILLIMALNSVSVFAQTSKSRTVEDLYTSPERKKIVENQYSLHKSSFSNMTVDDAIVGIQDMINQGYKAADKKNGLQGYIDDIRANKNNLNTVQEIYYTAVMTSVPPAHLLVSTEAGVNEELKKSKADIEKSLGISIEELQKVAEEQNKMKIKPLPRLSN